MTTSQPPSLDGPVAADAIPGALRPSIPAGAASGLTIVDCDIHFTPDAKAIERRLPQPA